MKSDYFIVEIRYRDDIKHKPVKRVDIRHSIIFDNPGVIVRVKRSPEGHKILRKYKGRTNGVAHW